MSLEKTYLYGYISCGIVLLLLTIPVRSQIQDCSADFFRSLDYYHSGQIDSCISNLNQCLSNKHKLRQTTKPTRSEMYRIAGLSSILLDNPVDLEFYVLGLLSTDPDYIIREDDFEEFNRSIISHLARPKHSFGVRAGVNLGGPGFEELYAGTSFGDNHDSFSEITSDQVHFLIGLNYEHFFHKRLSFYSDLIYHRYSIHYKLMYSINEEPIKLCSINSFEIPLMMKYSILKKSHLNLYIAAGASLQLTTLSDGITVMGGKSPFGRYKLYITPERAYVSVINENLNGFYASTSVGLSYRINSSIIGVDMRIRFPFQEEKLISPSNNFYDLTSNESILYYSDVVINLFKLTSFQLSLTYNHVLNYKIFKR